MNKQFDNLSPIVYAKQMIQRLHFLLALFSILCFSAQAQYRPYNLTQDVTRVGVPFPISCYQGESLDLTLKSVQGGAAYAIPTNDVVRWDLSAATNANMVYFSITGTLHNATNGISHFYVPFSNVVLAVGQYRGYVHSLAYSGTNLTDHLILQNQNLDVRPSSAAVGSTIVPTVPFVQTVNGLNGSLQIVGRSNITATTSGTNIFLDAQAGGGGSADAITNNQTAAALGSLNVSNVLHFGTTPATGTQQGDVYWNATNETLMIIDDADANIRTPVNHALHAFAQNKAGSTVTAGQPVRVASDAGGTFLRFDLASATNAIAGKFLGVALHTISNNVFGHISSYGMIEGLNTASWANGDDLYLDGLGMLTNDIPALPARPTHVGYVVRSHASQGSIFVQAGSPESDPMFGAVSNSMAQSIASNAANISTRLASNVWDAADSTTNYVRRTGDTMTGNLNMTNSAVVIRGGSNTKQLALQVSGSRGPELQFVPITVTTQSLNVMTNGAAPTSFQRVSNATAYAIFDQGNAAIFNIVTNLTLLGGMTGGITGSTLTVDGTPFVTNGQITAASLGAVSNTPSWITLVRPSDLSTPIGYGSTTNNILAPVWTQTLTTNSAASYLTWTTTATTPIQETYSLAQFTMPANATAWGDSTGTNALSLAIWATTNAGAYVNMQLFNPAGTSVMTATNLTSTGSAATIYTWGTSSVPTWGASSASAQWSVAFDVFCSSNATIGVGLLKGGVR